MLTRSSPGRPPRAALLGVTLAGAAAYAVLVRRLWPFTVDDTFITLRYARHLAAGLGLNFDPGPVHAEGYTSLTWTMLLAFPHALGLDAVFAAKALGVALTLAAAALAGAWARAEARADGGHAAAAFATAALYLAIPATAVHAVSGMETPLATLALVALLATAGAAVREAGTDASDARTGLAPAGAGTRAMRALAPLATLLAWTRPEGALAGALAILAVLALRPGDRRAQLERAGVAFALPLLVGEFVRLRYYGLPLPLPFYVKLAHPGRFAGAGVIGHWLGTDGWRPGLLGAIALVRPPRSLWPALLVTAALAAFFTLPQHLMGYQHRYVAPCDAVLALLAGVGLDRAVRGLSRRPRFAPLARWGAPLVVLAVAALELADAHLDVAERLDYARGMARAHLPVAHALAALGAQGRLVLSDAGSIPYYTDWATRDLVGLNDPVIAVTHRRDPADLLAPAPDVVALVSRQRDAFRPWDWNAYETPIHAECLRRGYARIAVREFGPDYWLWVMAKPGTKAAAALEAMPPAP